MLRCGAPGGGIDKFFNLLTNWPPFEPLAVSLLPVSPDTAMRVIGVVEIVVGIIVFSRWTVLGSLIAAAWLVAIALNLLAGGFFDIAVRDLVLAVAAYTLAVLTVEHETRVQPAQTVEPTEPLAGARTAA